MTAYLLAGPAVEPIALGDAKSFLRVEDTAEDDFISTLITAARLHIEGVTAKALISQSWRVVLDDWPQIGLISLPVAPVITLSAVTIFDDDGEPTELALGQLMLEGGGVSGRLILPDTVDGDTDRRRHQGIEIDYVAGYGTEAAHVPAPLKQAILSLIGHWFENREAVVIAGSGVVVPLGFDTLIAPYRRVSL